jgi:citrate lyase subunit alpha/citrate CoA-transferase
MIVAPLYRARLPIVVDRVLSISTPGDTIDVLVTQRGIAVNPKNVELKERLTAAGLPIVDIHELRKIAEAYTDKPMPAKTGNKVVANILYRDGRLLDTIKNVL